MVNFILKLVRVAVAI